MTRTLVPWTSGADQTGAFSVPGLRGRVARVVLMHPAGASQPSDGYSAGLRDANGIDVFANRVVASVAAPVDFCPLTDDGTLFSLAENCVFTIANAGINKTGVAAIYMQE